MAKTKVYKKSRVKSSPSKTTPRKGQVSKMDPVAALLSGLPRRDDYTVKYYFATVPGVVTAQADRDFVAQALTVFAPRSKRDKNLTTAEVIDLLPADVQGITTNRTAATALPDVFKAAKHILGLAAFIRAESVNHNHVSIYLSVDGSPFVQA